MVHVLEKIGTKTQLVKSYSRSAADSNMVVPQHLRPFNVLRVTVAYLLFELYGLPLNDFDPVLHKKYLLECLKWFLSCCDDTKDLEDYSDEEVMPSGLCDLMATMDIEPGNKLACDRVLMECLRALKVLSLAYDSRRLAVPSAVLRRWLALSSDAETRDVCRHYGLAVAGDSIRFDKDMLKADAKM
ncbi:80 kDa MCM3-associated protein, partial [Operophtera brumata]